MNQQHRTPINAQLASMAASILLVLSRNLDQLTGLVVFSSMIHSVLTFYAVIRFRQGYP